jgi:hypothetical protein
MIEFRPKLWTGASAAVLLAAGAGLDACSKGSHATAPVSISSTPVAAAVGEGGEGGAEGGGEAGAQQAFNAIPGPSKPALRLGQLKGFVLIAQRQTAGAEAAGILLSQGLTETFDKQKAAYVALGVDETILRKAAKSGTKADLQAALDNISHAQTKAGGDDAAVVKGLVDIAAGLYKGAIQPDSIDPVDYQHSLGAAMAAQELAAGSKDAKAHAAKADVDALVKLWPALSAPDKPTPASQILAQASRIELELS